MLVEELWRRAERGRSSAPTIFRAEPGRFARPESGRSRPRGIRMANDFPQVCAPHRRCAQLPVGGRGVWHGILQNGHSPRSMIFCSLSSSSSSSSSSSCPLPPFPPPRGACSIGGSRSSSASGFWLRLAARRAARPPLSSSRLWLSACCILFGRFSFALSGEDAASASAEGASPRRALGSPTSRSAYLAAASASCRHSRRRPKNTRGGAIMVLCRARRFTANMSP